MDVDGEDGEKGDDSPVKRTATETVSKGLMEMGE